MVEGGGGEGGGGEEGQGREVEENDGGEVLLRDGE